MCASTRTFISIFSCLDIGHLVIFEILKRARRIRKGSRYNRAMQETHAVLDSQGKAKQNISQLLKWPQVLH